jgi:hypothetical protein
MHAGDDIDELVEQITVDAYGDEGYWSFLQAIEDEATFPFTATIVGVPVRVTSVDFDGDERRGLLASIEREGIASTISILDLDVTGADPTIARVIAAYRRWLRTA